jgi:glycoprotein endo-alpha-1,2-mannosidase
MLKMYKTNIAILLVLSIFFSTNSQSSITQKTTVEIKNTTIIGKVLAGYQGWFNAKNDGAELGWKHYGNNNQFNFGNASIDFWPDVYELDKDELYETEFTHINGKPAYVFSSANSKTVNRHFKWMNDYGIDGVFAQRFVVGLTRGQKRIDNYNKVFDNCFIAAKDNNRLLSLMYDLSGTDNTNVVETTIQDWKQLVKKYKLNDPTNPNILTYKGKAVVSIWGVGFKNRKYTLDNIKELIDFFKNDAEYGNCVVLLGLPTGWRELERDAVADTKLHDVIKMADIVHPWTPGRYKTLTSADKHKEDYTIKDQQWCNENGLLYMPVVFPGFSWANMKKDASLFNQIPRLKGEFLWRQYYNAISSNVKTIYVAMFDEIDEGTCIFKVDNNPPAGKSEFLTYEGLPSDYYLWQTGQAGKMLRKEIPLSKAQPIYPN